MLDQLLPHYEKELGYLRSLAGEFATRNPKIAQRLSLQGDRCEDPHVERLIEAFAFLSARIHRRLDDEFPQITEGFLQALYPHYLRPMPATTILCLEMDEHINPLSGRYTVARHQQVVTPPINGEPCLFRTAYDVDLSPLKLAAARLDLVQPSPELRGREPDAYAALTLELKTSGSVPIEKLGLKKLRFFIDAEPQLSHFIYELILTQCIRVDIASAAESPELVDTLPAGVVRAVGFAPEESLLDCDARTFSGYLQLIEYFACPEKYLFIDITGIEEAFARCAGDSLRIRLWLKGPCDVDRLQRSLDRIGKDNFRLHCTPAINLFRKGVDPIRISHHVDEYPVVPDARRPLAFEVVSIDSVLKIDRKGGSEATCEVLPIYATDRSFRSDRQQLFWYALREPSAREYDNGTDLRLLLVDGEMANARPEAETLSLVCTCSNRDGPELLAFGGSAPLYQLPGHSVVARVRPLRKPSRTLRPPERRGLQWRLIAHLSLNLQSLVGNGPEALRQLLQLYDFTADAANLRQINALVELRSKPATERIGSSIFPAFVRGTEVEISLNESDFVGSGAYLLSSILERFIGLYCAPNSFTRLRVHSQQRGDDLFVWPARSGDAVLI